MILQHLYLAIMWMLFCVLHSVLASLWWKSKIEAIMGGQFRYYRLYYTLFAFLSLGAVVWYQFQLRSQPVFVAGTSIRTIGALLAAAGLVLMGVCIRKYFLHLSGLKSLYLNDQQAANELQVTGIHRFIRHPLYTGTFMTIWGLWLCFPSLGFLIANTIITSYTILAIRWEEQKLVAEFGERYRHYQQQVPRLLPLPGKTMR